MLNYGGPRPLFPAPLAARKPRAGRICPGLLWGPPPFPSPAAVFRGPAAPKTLPLRREKTAGGRVKKQGAGPNSRNRPRGYGRTSAAQGTPRGLLAEERGQRSPGAGLWASLCARSPAAHGPGPPAAAKRESGAGGPGTGAFGPDRPAARVGTNSREALPCRGTRKAAFRPGAKRSGSGRPGRGLRNLCSPERRFRWLAKGREGTKGQRTAREPQRSKALRGSKCFRERACSTRRNEAPRSQPQEPEANLCRPPVAGISAEVRSPETERQQP